MIRTALLRPVAQAHRCNRLLSYPMPRRTLTTLRDNLVSPHYPAISDSMLILPNSTQLEQLLNYLGAAVELHRTAMPLWNYKCLVQKALVAKAKDQLQNIF